MKAFIFLGKLNNHLQEFCNFYILLSLLLGNVINLVDSNPVSPSNKVSTKTFAEKLSNPCSLIDENSLEGDGSPAQLVLSSGILDMMNRRIPKIKDIIEAILKAVSLFLHFITILLLYFITVFLYM